MRDPLQRYVTLDVLMSTSFRVKRYYAVSVSTQPFFVHASCAAGVKKQERFTVLTKEQLFFSKLFDESSSQGDFTITTEDEIRNAFELFDADQSGSVCVCLCVRVFVCARVILLRVLTFAIP